MTHLFTRPAALSVAALLCLACAACTAGKSTSATSPASTATGKPEGASRDLSEVSCTGDPATGEWSFAGKLTNTSGKPSEYRIRVSLVKKEGSTVVTSKEVTQKVASGATAQVKADKLVKPFEKPAELTCIPTTTVRRG